MEKIIDRPVLSVLFFVFIIIVGYHSFVSMPIETVPNVEGGLPTLYVTYTWPGASPDMILQNVLIPAEGEITQIKGVKKIKSRAEQSMGVIDIEFLRDVRMNFAEVDLTERLNRIQRNFPREVLNPQIQQRTPEEFKSIPLLKIGLFGEHYSVYTIRKIAEKEIVPYLKSIPGLESVVLAGGVEPEIKIQTNMERLKKFNLNIRIIQARINESFFTRSSLAFIKDTAEITLALTENPKRIEDLRNIVIAEAGEKKIYLKEIADVFMGYQRLTEERRYQGKPYVQIDIFREPRASMIDTARLVKDKLRYLTQKLHGSIGFVIQGDDSKVLTYQLIKLGKISLLVLLIIFAILMIIIRDVKASLLVFSSVFFSVFATFTFVYLFKIPLNLLTLSGLSLGFGMFVDNAVVVFDSILRFREHGYSARESAIQGPKAVIMPVLASTLTHIIVFFSFALFFQDRLRVYYLPLAYIITIALLSSIVVAYVSIPSIAARIKLKIKRETNEKELFQKGKFFPFIIRYPLIVLLPIIAMLVLSFLVFKKEVSFGRFFNFYDKQVVSVWLKFPTGAEFEDVKEAILKFEKVAMEKPYPKEVNTSITRNSAEMRVEFPPEIESTSHPIELKQELVGMATNLAGVGVSIHGFDQEPYYYNPDTGSMLPFDIRLTGYNFEKLMDFSGDLKKTLLRHKRIKEADIQTDMRFWWGGKEKYYSFRFSREKLKIYNLQPAYVMYLIRTMVREGTAQIRLKYDDKDMSVEIKASDVESLELDDILDRYFFNLEGVPFRLRDIVDVEFSIQKGGITRENQEYQCMVQWDYMGSSKSGDRFHKGLYERLAVPPGFKKSLEQLSMDMTEEEKGQLWVAIFLSLFLIYMILVILYEDFFQPFLIMLTIPLALIGVFIAFVVMDYSFDSSAYVGVILLAGIVVSNSIILIDNINRYMKESPQIIRAIAIGTKERIRPVFMTSATTILGMLPMVLFKETTASNNSADIWSSLALCTVGGLTTSTILILVVLPIFYYYFYKFEKHISDIRNKNKGSNHARQ
ncbi:MAG: efflux RND transporter permease subunit [Candidatus Omnitrophota bacterium]